MHLRPREEGGSFVVYANLLDDGYPELRGGILFLLSPLDDKPTLCLIESPSWGGPELVNLRRAMRDLLTLYEEHREEGLFQAGEGEESGD